jgi:Sulfotransferase family
MEVKNANISSLFLLLITLSLANIHTQVSKKSHQEMMITTNKHYNNNKKQCIFYYYYLGRSLQFWALLALTTWCLLLFAQIFTNNGSLHQPDEHYEDAGSTRLLLLLQQRKGQYHHHQQQQQQQHDDMNANLLRKQQQQQQQIGGGVVVHLETASQESLAAAAAAAAAVAAAKAAAAQPIVVVVEQPGPGDDDDEYHKTTSTSTLRRLPFNKHPTATTTTRMSQQQQQQQQKDDDDDDDDETSTAYDEFRSEPVDSAAVVVNNDEQEAMHDVVSLEEAEQDENENNEPGNNNNEEYMVEAANSSVDETSKEEEEDTVGNDVESNHDTVHYYNCTNEKGQVVTLQQVPAFIIIGAQKAGTSALYDLLNLHPLLQGSRNPETHFFDRRLPINYLQSNNIATNNVTWANEYRCKVREIYAKKFFPYEMLLDQPQIKFFDKTPAYITSTGAPFRVHAIAPWSKIILSLRNPVHRAFSQHRMEWLPQQAHLTFEERIGVSLDMLRTMPQYSINQIPATDNFTRPSRQLMRQNTTADYAKIDAADVWKQRNMIHRGFYLEQLKPWLQYYTLGKTLLVVQYEVFQRHPEKVLHQILDFVGVERPPPGSSGIYSEQVLAQPYGPGRMRASPGSSMAEVPAPTPEALEFLAKLYRPFNEELANVLGEEWRGVWD